MPHEKDKTLAYFDGNLPESFSEAQGDTYKAAVVAVDTRGTHPRYGQLVELALISLEVQQDPVAFTRVLSSHHWFQEPEGEISEGFTNATGLTEDMLAGQSIDFDTAEEIFENCELVISFNAGNVRPFLEREFNLLEEKVFACARNQVDWPSHGYECRVMRHIAMDQGWYFDGRRSNVIAGACVKLLNEKIPDSQDTLLAELISRAQEPLITVEAKVPPREKHLLKKERFNFSKERGVWVRCMGQSTLNRVKATLDARGFTGELEEKEQLPAYERFKLS